MINYSEFEPSLNTHPCLELFHPELACQQFCPHHPSPAERTDPSAPDDLPPHLQDHSHEHHPRSFTEHSHHLLDLSLSQSQAEQLVGAEESEWWSSRRKEERRLKNETKNIPKNFGKGIISFIEKNEKKMRALLLQHKLPFHSFKNAMRHEKKTINTIADLRRLWTSEPYCRCLRIISNLFFRKHALDYIFNSRISNYASHVKYRQSLWQALSHPHDFNRIKEY